ncbi:MAG: mechanosensitive ion channel family protein [Ilumatobacter sp.]|uniref:mechanosensitive ion channel family protein n=1 Tax=Ilumatobacter sp. TaxID=1967498 RepID=UPI003C76C64E
MTTSALAFATRLRLRQSDSDPSSGSDGESTVSDAADQAKGLSAGDWLQAGIIVGVAIALAFVVALLIRRLVRRRNEMLATLAGRVAATIVFVIGFVYGLNSIGVAVGPLVGGLGIGGLAVAFAMKSILSNILAGILIQLRQPFQVGHLVRLGDYFGRIEAVTLRTVDMETLDGEYVLIPAAMVVENPIENWTTLGKRREEVIVGISYDTDPDEAAAGIKQAVSELDVVLDDKEVKVVITEFAGSSVNLRVLAWHSIDDHFLDVTHAIAAAAKRWLEQNDRGIPFPIRTLQLDDPAAIASAFNRDDSDPTSSASPRRSTRQSPSSGDTVSGPS